MSVEASQGRLLLFSFESYTLRLLFFFFLTALVWFCRHICKSFAYTALIITIFPQYCALYEVFLAVDIKYWVGKCYFSLNTCSESDPEEIMQFSCCRYYFSVFCKMMNLKRTCTLNTSCFKCMYVNKSLHTSSHKWKKSWQVQGKYSAQIVSFATRWLLTVGYPSMNIFFEFRPVLNVLLLLGYENGWQANRSENMSLFTAGWQ